MVCKRDAAVVLFPYGGVILISVNERSTGVKLLILLIKMGSIFSFVF